jgi:hypothetical protein
MKVTRPFDKPKPCAGYFFSDISLYFSKAKTFIPPDARKTRLSNPCTVHNAIFIAFLPPDDYNFAGYWFSSVV